MKHDITGRDGMIMAEALAFAYAAMQHLPLIFQPHSNMADMREILFTRCSEQQAEYYLGQAMLKAWNLRADAPPSSGRDRDEFANNLRLIRAQVLAEPPNLHEEMFEADDVAVLVRHIDDLLRAHAA